MNNKTANIQLSFNEIRVIQGALFEYYNSLKQQPCEVEKTCVKTITSKLNEAGTNIFKK